MRSEVKTSHRIARAGYGLDFVYIRDPPIGDKLYHPTIRWIEHRLGVDRSPEGATVDPSELGNLTLNTEGMITKHKSSWSTSQELNSDQKLLNQAIGTGLQGLADHQP